MKKTRYENLTVERMEAITVVTINRPERANAVNLPLLRELRKLSDDMRTDLKTRVVIFTGAGKVFCSGVDVSKEGRDHWYDYPQPNERLYQRHGQDTMHGIENLDQITIAAVNGSALGAGLCIATSCDFRIASEKAIFGVPETGLGFLYSLGCSYSLLALIGPSNAKRLIMTGDRISAQEALAMGLVNKVVPPEQLMSASTEMAEKITSKAPSANRVNKKMINAASIARMYDLCLCETELVAGVQSSAGELEEGLQSYREKRQPRFAKD